MKKLTLAILLTLSGGAFAQSSSLKPGLWETKPISQIVDGHDMTAQMASAQVKMQQAMANMSPEQRKQMEAMLGHQGTSAGGGRRFCVSTAMAAKDAPMVDPEGRCKPATVNRSGNKTSFEFNCTANGRTSIGKGESTISGNTVTTRVDMTMTDTRGRHTMHSESQMNFLGSDCQGITPLDQLAKKAQNAAH
jgi:hypothetical protein